MAGLAEMGQGEPLRPPAVARCWHVCSSASLRGLEAAEVTVEVAIAPVAGASGGGLADTPAGNAATGQAACAISAPCP